ncbi:ShlB/FhaC/HecB family hemolysin secretion/activation protein [Rhabdochlamydiaceae symbiont of Dictyostelium giganteum]|uniref:ShlB/FhaC/HecB family hemolysin secretion/activation protein n=1 Tax=Rhabdochlamydiaceae symbiont of Dictyostelium giganteum TaxID=3342349 RepID=UPI00384B6B36
MIKQKWVLLLWSFLPFSVSGSFTPPAGVVERELEEQYEDSNTLPKENNMPLLQWESFPENVITGEETVTLQKIEVRGNAILTNEYLEKECLSYLDKPLNLNDLEELCLHIQAIYEKQGYFLVTAYLPPQEITEGVLIIEVIEGRLGSITVEGNKFYSAHFIESYFLPFQNTCIHYQKFMKALLLLNENMDLHVEGTLKRGRDPGAVDLILNVKDQHPFHLAFDVNNEGSEETTNWRSGAKLERGNNWIMGDKITLIQVAGAPPSHLYFFDLIYHVPLTLKGLFFEASYLGAFFKTSPLLTECRGRSQIEEMKMIYAVKRDPHQSVNSFMQLQRKKLQNFGSLSSLNDDKLTILGGGFSMDTYDSFKGRVFLEGKLSIGIPHFLGSMGAKSPHSSRVGAGGEFLKLQGEFKRFQPLIKGLLWKMKGGFQLSLNKLPLGEQIYLGGVDTVRGYPLAQELGDHGYYLSSEMHLFPSFFRSNSYLPFDPQEELFYFTGFIDLGQTFSIGGKDMIRNGHVIEALQTHQFLCSIGPGLRFRGPYQMKWSIDAGFPQTNKGRFSHPLIYFKLGRNF